MAYPASKFNNNKMMIVYTRTIYILLGPFMSRHKWSRGTNHDNITGLGTIYVDHLCSDHLCGDRSFALVFPFNIRRPV